MMVQVISQLSSSGFCCVLIWLLSFVLHQNFLSYQSNTVFVTAFNIDKVFVPSSNRISSLSSSLIKLAATNDIENSAVAASSQQSKTSNSDRTNIKVPLTWDEMIRQVATSMKEASTAGVKRQIIRILLPRDSTSGDFGKYLEKSSDVNNNNNMDSDIKLVPPDESWQGGIMQLYRAAAPTATEIVRKVSSDLSTNNLPPRITEDRSVDESGVDGVGLLTTDDKSITCWIQPTQENVDEFIASANKAKDNEIVALVNPQWRQVDDALDTASKQSSNPFFQGLANFLGGKGAVLQRIADVGYQPVYTLEGYVCRGANVRLLQVYPSLSWSVYCERDDLQSYILIGTTASGHRPTYQQVDEMMKQSDIGYKYARDIGLQPKL